ncbi:MAG: hypothetical protein IJ571_10755 [Ruminococcus sp.]|nr:hypothetical protein [Ruminococcus sp.]
MSFVKTILRLLLIGVGLDLVVWGSWFAYYYITAFLLLAGSGAGIAVWQSKILLEEDSLRQCRKVVSDPDYKRSAVMTVAVYSLSVLFALSCAAGIDIILSYFVKLR